MIDLKNQQIMMSYSRSLISSRSSVPIRVELKQSLCWADGSTFPPPLGRCHGAPFPGYFRRRFYRAAQKEENEKIVIPSMVDMLGLVDAEWKGRKGQPAKECLSGRFRHDVPIEKESPLWPN